MAVWRVTITATSLGQRYQNVLHFATATTPFTDQNVKDEVRNQWIPVIWQLQNQALVYVSITTQQLAPTLQPAIVWPITGAGGGLSGKIAHPSLAGLFSLRSAATGRRGRGRFYLFGVHDDSHLNGVVQTCAYTDYQVKAASLKARFCQGGSGPMLLVIAPRNNPSNYVACTDIIVKPTFGIQRRRNVGVGS